MSTVNNFINGKQSSFFSNEFIPIHDPSTGEEISKVVL